MNEYTNLNVTFYSYSYFVSPIQEQCNDWESYSKRDTSPLLRSFNFRKLKIINLIAQQNGNNITVSLHNN